MGLLILGCCVFAIGVLVYHRCVRARKLLLLDSVLSFAELTIDECLITDIPIGDQIPEGSAVVEETRSTLEESKANAFAASFAAEVRKYFAVITHSRYDFAYTYELVFKSKDSSWKFQFGYVPHETLLGCETPDGFFSGTIMLQKKAGPALETLIRSVLENNAER